MKRAISLLTVLAIGALFVIGCESPQAKAQKLYSAGRYEDVIAQYGREPSAAPVVQQAKDKIAERWYTEGRYQAVLDSFPTSPSAHDARNRLAEQWLNQKRYQDVVDKFPDTPAATQAHTELARMSDTTKADRTAVEQPRGSTSVMEAAADAEYQRVMAIKMKDMRMKALREFVANPRYAGTGAQHRAQQELNHP